MKKKLLMVILIVAILFTAGCSKSIDATDKKGNMIKRTLSEIYAESKYGFYVKNLDGTFTPVMNDTPGYSSSSGFSFDSAGRFIWWCDTNINGKDIVHENLIPVVSDETPLVIVYGQDSDIPDSYFIEEYKDLGYTVGVKFELGEDKNSLFFKKSEICPYSSFNSVSTPDPITQVIEINDSDKLPLRNIESIGTMSGLQANKFYKFTCFVGTSTRTYTVSADTRVFKATNKMTLDIPITKTRDHYFIINVPSNLEDGYYYINNSGMFKVASQPVQETAPVEEAPENETQVESPQEEPQEEPKNEENISIITPELISQAKALMIPALSVSGGMLLLSIITTWMLLKKAGEKGWKSLIPIYGTWTLFKVVYGSGIRMLLVMLPIIGIVFYVLFLIDLCRSYGRRKVWFKLGMIFLTPIFMIILALGKARYRGTKEELYG